MKSCAHRILLAGVIMIAMAAMVVACDDDDDPTDPDGGTFNGTITVSSNQFSPANVTIDVGDSVTWRFQGGGHTVTHGTSPTVPPNAQKLFDTPTMTSGTFGYRFNNAGTFAYFCRLHFPTMTGTVTVKP